MNRKWVTRQLGRAFRLHQLLYVGIPSRFPGRHWWSFLPTQMFVSPTLRCNIRCEFCFEIEDIEEKAYQDDELTLDQWKEAVDRIPSKTLITFIGGELFMRKDALDLFEYSARKHRITVCTNGTMLTPDILERLMALVPKRPWHNRGLIEIGVSLQGREEVHDDIVRVKGSYERTLRGLGYLQQARAKQGNTLLPFTTLRGTMQPKNIECLPHLYDLVKQFDIDTIDLQVMQDSRSVQDGWDHFDDAFELESFEGRIDFDRFRDILLDLTTRSDGPTVSFTPAGIPLDEVLKIYKRTADLQSYRCVLPWHMHGVHPDGQLTPCTQAYFPDLNIKQTDIATANQSDLFRDFREKIATHGIYPMCLGCCGSRFVGSTDKAAPRLVRASAPQTDPEPTQSPTP